MILFLDTADVLGITVIFAGELKSSSPFYDPTATTGDKYVTRSDIAVSYTHLTLPTNREV